MIIKLLKTGVACFVILITMSCNKDFDFVKSNEIPDFPTDNWIQVSDVADYSWSLDKLKSAEKFSKNSGSECVMIIESGKLIYA